MKRRDCLILAVVLMASLALYLLRPDATVTDTTTTYLRISVPGQTYELVPLTGEQEIVLEQADGSRNVVQVEKDGFYMKESNCTNQDCILQGVVTTQNMDSRALANQIICLPHKVVLELVTGDTQTVEITP